MSEEDVQAIVIDNGSYMCRAGFSGDEKPKSEFPPVFEKDYNGYKKKLYSIQRSNLGDYIEEIWNRAFHDELHADPSEHPVLLTDTFFCPKRDREKMIVSMFDTFNVPSFYVENQDALSMYANARTTGVVLRVGEGSLSITPLYNGEYIRSGMNRFQFAGCDLSEWMARILMEKGLDFTKPSDKEIARDIIEKTCYVALDYQAEMEKALYSTEMMGKEYCLPNGGCISLKEERFRCPELLFEPYMNGLDFKGIHELLFDSIMKCPSDLRKEMFRNIILSGGSTMFEGFKERIEKEITALAPPTMEINVIALSERNKLTFVGGSILSYLETFPQMCISREEYNEEGPHIVHRLICY